MKRRKFTRKERVLLTTAVASVVIVGAGAGAFFRRPATQYNPEERVEGITSELERDLPPDYPRVKFTETASQAGIRFKHFYKNRSTQLPEDMGSGAAWGDYDNDGDDDLFVVNISGPLTMSKAEAAQSPATCRLYRNNGDGTFTDVTEQAGLVLRVCGMGAAWGDYDGDGWLDLVVTAYPDLFLFRNRGDGTFADVSRSSGVGAHKGFWAGASWADYDRDGDLDLYVCGYVKYRFDPADLKKVALHYQSEIPFTLNPSSYPPERNLLLRNEGKGVFIEVAKEAGVDNPTGRSLSASWCDFDDDGWLDLYVANDISDNAMFKNLGNGKFKDISYQAAVADYRGAMGLGVSDWDGDGDFDIFVTHWIAQENALYRNDRTPSYNGKRGDIIFMDVADQNGLGQIALDFIGWGTSFFDYDNDGKPDLFVANGSTFQSGGDLIPMRHLLFWNRGNLDGFFETGAVSGSIFKRKTVGRGAAFSDYDGDGDVDIFVVNHSGAPWLLRNDGGNKKRWLKVRAIGKRNHFAFGAKVKVTANGVTQTQQIGAQSSYLSQNSLLAHFGVGSAETVDKVAVIFPSGKVVERESVETNQTVEVREE